MRVLVTGANGFVGRSICEDLQNNSINLVKLIRQNPDRIAISESESESEVFFADITDEEFIKNTEKIGNIDVVIHTAGLAHQFGDISKEDFWKVNVNGTKNVAKLAKLLKAKHFILISSVSVYGEIEEANTQTNKSVVTELDECNPKGFYAESKYQSELVCREVLSNKTTSLTILRLATVIGEGDKGNVRRLINIINSGKFIWIGKGKNKKSLIYKRDIARAVTSILFNNKKRIEVFNLTANAVSMKDIVSTIAESLSARVFPINIPAKFVHLTLKITNKVVKVNKIIQLEKSINKWVSDDTYSGDALFKEYGFLPKTSVKEALEKEVKWYLNNK